MCKISRECCPKCNSTQIIKRGDEYGCTKCQARFITPAKKLLYTLANEYVSRRVTTALQMEALGKIHAEHPTYTRKDLKLITGYSDDMIRKHMKLYQVHYILRE